MTVCVVLVEPENPDNIGAVCRAMKNTGLADLRVVTPPGDWRKRAEKMALWAKDVLGRARSFSVLEEAVGDAVYVLGTTRRQRNNAGSFLGFRESLRKVQTMRRQGLVALVFGKESKGLSNQALLRCDTFTTIPSSPDYPSMNLAQAVMVMAFSLFAREKTSSLPARSAFLTQEEVKITLDRFKEAVAVLGYKPSIEKRIALTFHAMIKRRGLLKSESQMIKGLSRRIKERVSVKRPA